MKGKVYILYILQYLKKNMYLQINNNKEEYDFVISTKFEF